MTAEPRIPNGIRVLRVLCVVCGEGQGQSIYGNKCAACFEAQREERDVA